MENAQNEYTDSDNQILRNTMFSNICTLPFIQDQNECNSKINGVYARGYYTSIIRYWQVLKTVDYDFRASARSETDIAYYLQRNRLVDLSDMHANIFSPTLDVMQNAISNSINS